MELMQREAPAAAQGGRRHRLHTLIFEADTPGGKAFDLILLVAIGVSVLAVMLESMQGVQARYGMVLRGLEWGLTALFSVEYVLRLMAVKRPLKYALSFFGVVDLLALLPTYLSLVFVGAQSLVVVRALRLLRVFRVLKLTQFVGEARMLRAAMQASARKITVFIGTVLTVVLIAGTMMYLVEGSESGFTSIPRSVYWAIVTMTTVGYGDISPQTPLGQLLASMLMILGYGVIAVPTGIVTVQLAEAQRLASNTQCCPACGASGHANDAVHCKYCGEKL